MQQFETFPTSDFIFPISVTSKYLIAYLQLQAQGPIEKIGR